MSPTSTVPAAVPSLFQSARPSAYPAAKKTIPFTSVNAAGLELP